MSVRKTVEEKFALDVHYLPLAQGLIEPGTL